MDIIKCTPKDWIQNADTYHNELIKNWNSINLLNVNAAESIGNNTLVRFQCMIQDMYNPEYYYEKYVVVNESTQNEEIRYGKYQDAVLLDDKEYINTESKENITGDRNTFVAITVPCLNTWAKTITKEFNSCDTTASNADTRTKRSIDETSESMEVDSTVPVENVHASKKRLKCSNITASESHASALSKDYILNFPVPNDDGMTCLLKVYENGNTIKLNEMYEFVGFLSLNPMYANTEANDEEIDLEAQMHNPPTSLVPRIHCVSWKKLEHNNPLLDMREIALYNNKEKMCSMFKELHLLTTQLLLGDSLAASYMIYYLLSEIYSRTNMIALGKFALNISNVPSEIDDYGSKFYEFVTQLVVKSHYLPLTIDNLNTLTFTPKKDYECNRLTSGLLQLSKNSHLILDETKLKEGKLNEAGVKCVTAITDMINNQNVKYDFVYYQMDFDCDIPVLILSEGKSMLMSDFHVRLQPNEEYVSTFEEILEALGKLLNVETLNNLRIYLTATRFLEYNLKDNVQELIENEFVNLRKENKCSATDLHNLLVLSRLVCLAEGENVLNESSWKKAVELERQRKARL